MEAELEAVSVQHFAENYLLLCGQRIRCQTGDHNLRHTYISDIHVCKILGRSLAQAVSRTVEDLSCTQAIRICGGQSGIRTSFLSEHTISPVGTFAQCSMFVLHLSPKLNNFNNS
jgi:hypothetical protein